MAFDTAVEDVTLVSGGQSDTFLINGLPAAPRTVTLDDGGGTADTLNFSGWTGTGGVAVDVDSTALQSLSGTAATGPLLRLKPAGSTGRFENFTGSPRADIVYADPLGLPRTLAGGLGNDALWFEVQGVDVTDSGSVLAAAGFGDVTYSSFESARVWARKKRSWTIATRPPRTIRRGSLPAVSSRTR